MKVEVVSATREHAARVADDLAAEEREEYTASEWSVITGSARELLFSEMNASFMSWAIVADDRAVALFGVIGGNVWFIVSNEFKKISLRFIRQAGPYIDELVNHCGMIWCDLLKSQHRMIRWLKYAGFRVYPISKTHARCEKWASHRPQ
jgi:hypothetical protein